MHPPQFRHDAANNHQLGHREIPPFLGKLAGVHMRVMVKLIEPSRASWWTTEIDVQPPRTQVDGTPVTTPFSAKTRFLGPI